MDRKWWPEVPCGLVETQDVCSWPICTQCPDWALLKVLRRSGESLLTSPVSPASTPGTTCCSSSKDEVSGWHVGTEYFLCYQVLMFWVRFPSAEMEEVDQTSLWWDVPWSGKFTLGLSGLPHTRTDSATIRRQGKGNVSFLSLNYQFSF